MGSKRTTNETRAARRQARNAASAEQKRLAALEQERKAEALAPAHARKPVMGADGRMLRGPLVAIVGGRVERHNPVAAIRGQRGEFPVVSDRDPVGEIAARSSRSISQVHVDAARLLQADWRDVGAGISVSGADYAGAAGCGRGSGLNLDHHISVLRQIDARRRLDGALTWLGSLCDIVAPVVLDCVPVTTWATDRGMDPRHAVGYLAAALTKLAEFYASKGEVRDLGTINRRA